jgi:hypothetical protein
MRLIRSSRGRRSRFREVAMEVVDERADAGARLGEVVARVDRAAEVWPPGDPTTS